MRQLPPETRPDVAARRAQVELFLNLGRIQAVVARRTAALFAAEGIDGITPAQANALMVLFQARGPLTARALATRLGVAEPTVSRFVQTLERGGWVRRRPDPSDGRARRIEATPKARAALPRFTRVANALLDAAFAGLGAETLEALDRGVERVVQNLDTSVQILDTSAPPPSP